MVVPLTEVYDAVGVDQMKEDEKAYMQPNVGKTTGVILAAGGENIGPLTENTPRAMLDIRGKSILERQVDALNRCNIKDVAVVRGYKKEQVQLPSIRTYDNDEFANTGEVVSLFKAAAELDHRVVILYGDILFEQAVMEKLLRSTADITVVVDRSLADRTPDQRAARVRDYVIQEAPAVQSGSVRYVASEETHRVRRIGSKIDPREANAEFVGMLMLNEKGARSLRDAWIRATERTKGRFHEAAELKKATLTDLLQEMVESGVEVNAVEIYKGWMEIDTFEDYQRAWASLR